MITPQRGVPVNDIFVYMMERRLGHGRMILRSQEEVTCKRKEKKEKNKGQKKENKQKGNSLWRS